ncbi:YitT family protein [Amphibacillus sediminis]|uniref:YitT family protein n=1 Tax=Amphibacillus sediminis TaxID=360185 RepID=UPI0008341D48|nr:YitT family protein [Amphibacillus sediminis]
MRSLVIIIGSVIVATSFNLFLVPHGLLSSGVSGIAILISLITPFKTGLLNFALNVPILILGFVKLGRTITYNTIACVISLSLFLYLIPEIAVVEETLLSSIVGGVMAGVGIGLILKYSGTSGGFDIIAMIVSRMSNIRVGLLLTGMNGIIVLISGAIFDWNIAIYTMLSIYITGRVIDTVHTNHIKLTLQIVTTCGEQIRQELLDSIYRGITITNGYGGYTMEEKQILMMVVTRYETMLIKKIVRKHDPNAFINIYETVEVDGEFAQN